MQTIDKQLENQVYTIHLNRPEVHNAFDPVMISELRDAFLNLPPQARVVVIRGVGRSFSAGADLNWMRSMAEADLQENKADALKLYDMFQAIRTAAVPVIARIHGAALGGGTGLASVCDIVFCEEKAKFGFTEVRLGLMPAVISPFVIEKIGKMQARRWFLTGERFSAVAALQMGLVHEVFAGEVELDQALQRTIKGVLSSSPQAVRRCKQLIDEIGLRDPKAVRSFVADGIASIRVSAEGQEGLNAFLNKKIPDWEQFVDQGAT